MAKFSTVHDADDHSGVTGLVADAANITFTPAGTIAATDVQAAIEEVASEAAGGGALDYIRIEDQKTQNTAGGTATAGSWETRTLNTEVTDTGGNATLSSNQITLAAGTYECRIVCPATYVDGHQARLQNVTAGTTLILGQNAYSSNQETDVTATPAFVSGVFTVAGSQALEVQHRVQATRATSGYGTELNWGTEVYTVAEFWKRS